MKWSAWIAVLAGVCLLVAPLAAGYSGVSAVATAEAVVLGVLIAALALWAAFGTDVPHYVDYLLLACGAWSIVAPFALAGLTRKTARVSSSSRSASNHCQRGAGSRTSSCSFRLARTGAATSPSIALPTRCAAAGAAPDNAMPTAVATTIEMRMAFLMIPPKTHGGHG